MSSRYKKRIKQIKVNTGTPGHNDFSDPNSNYPIGADALYIDFLSNLDLEQELKIGGPHYVKIIEGDFQTKVQQWYFNTSISDFNRNVTVGDERITFSVETVIPNVGESSRINYLVDSNLNNIVTSSNGQDYLIAGIETRQQGKLNITITLYKGDFRDNNCVQLHTKTISLSQQASDNSYIINEQL